MKKQNSQQTYNNIKLKAKKKYEYIVVILIVSIYHELLSCAYLPHILSFYIVNQIPIIQATICFILITSGQATMPNTDILGQATMSVPSQGYDSDGCNLTIVLFVDCVVHFLT